MRKFLPERRWLRKTLVALSALVIVTPLVYFATVKAGLAGTDSGGNHNVSPAGLIYQVAGNESTTCGFPQRRYLTPHRRELSVVGRLRPVRGPERAPTKIELSTASCGALSSSLMLADIPREP